MYQKRTAVQHMPIWILHNLSEPIIVQEPMTPLIYMTHMTLWCLKQHTETFAFHSINSKKSKSSCGKERRIGEEREIRIKFKFSQAVCGVITSQRHSAVRLLYC